MSEHSTVPAAPESIAPVTFDVPVGAPTPTIEYADFEKVELLVGEIRAAEPVSPKAPKLLKLTVDFGGPGYRTVVAGIALTFTAPDRLVGRQFVFATNIVPRKVYGIESQAMILASGEATTLHLVSPTGITSPGSRLG